MAHRQHHLDGLDYAGDSTKCVPCRDVREWIRSRRRTRDWAPETDLEAEAGDGEIAFVLPKRRTYYYSIFAVRLAIMLMFTVLIGLLTILTWHFTTVYTTRSIKSLAFNLRTELLQRPISRMWNLFNVTLDTTLTQVNLSEYVIGRYPPTPVGQQQDELLTVMRNITWAIFTSRQAVDALSVVYRNGMIQGFERDSNPGQPYYEYAVPANASFGTGVANASGWDLEDNGRWTWYREPVDYRTGQAIGAPKVAVPYNLSQAFGSASLLETEDLVWHVTVHRSDDIPFLTSGSAVRHPQTGEVLAIAGVTQTLGGITTFLQELVQRNSGVMYLANDEGWLLASSTSTPLVKNTSSGPSLIRAEDSTDPVIRAGAQWLHKNYGASASALTSVHAEDIVLGGQKYYIDTFVLNLTQLPLVGVIFTPRSYVLGAVDKRGRTTLAILISISICILVAGCVFTLIFTSGVSTEMKLRAQLIDHLSARRRAEASSNCKSQFLANMSHELRTPMAAVIGLLDILLSDDYLSAEQVAMVSQIRHCSTALLRLLNNILDLSKVESGKLVLEEADFDLRHELEGLVDMFSVQCVDQNIDFVLDLDDNIPRLLRGDSARTVQIFANLLANSIKFTTSGHVLLRGWCEVGSGGVEKSGLLSAKDINHARPPKPGNPEGSLYYGDNLHLWFEVDDTGCGIDPGKWESVFDSFVQADASTTRNHGGTGLGLCIVRSLVNKMGGEIKIVTKDGPGTLFRMYVVFSRSSERYSPKNFKDHCASTMSSELLQETRLLLSMHGDKGRTTMAQWMRQNGIRVSEASNWESSLAELEGMVGDDNAAMQENYCSSVFAADADGTDNTSGGMQANLNDSHCKEANPGQQRLSAKPKALAILDVGMVSKMSDLEVLGRFTERGVIIAWLLNHDTSNNVKGELRKLGCTNMVNKPVHKSKLLQLLRVMVDQFRHPSMVKISDDSGSGISGVELSDGLSTLNKLSKGVAYHLSPLHAPLQSLQATTEHLRSQSFRGLDRISEREGDSPVSRQRRRSEQFSEFRAVGHTQNLLAGAANVGRGDGLDRDTSSFETQLMLRRDVAAPASEASKGSVLVGGKQQMLPWTVVEGTGRSNEGASTGFVRAEDAGIHLDVKRSLPLDPDQKVGGTVTPDRQALPALEITTAPRRVTPQQVAIFPRSRIGPHDALKGITILLAEDNLVLQRVASIMLEKLGATVVAVGDGVEAVNALAIATEPDNLLCDEDACNLLGSVQDHREVENLDRTRFDLILMDCQMPKVDGYQATRIIRKSESRTGSHIPIVALTAHAMSSDEAKCLDVGMDAYLTKPIDSKLMVSTILSLTRRKDGTACSGNVNH